MVSLDLLLCCFSLSFPKFIHTSLKCDTQKQSIILGESSSELNMVDCNYFWNFMQHAKR